MTALLPDSRSFSQQRGFVQLCKMNPAPVNRDTRKARSHVQATPAAAQALVSPGLPQERQSRICLQIIQEMIFFSSRCIVGSLNDIEVRNHKRTSRAHHQKRYDARRCTDE
jgi:hypothetical protein